MNKIRMLWADDQADVQETLASVLSGLCTDISHVADAQAALRQLQRESFDVLILDLKMPPGEWGGLWLLEEMQRSKINVATLVLSGQGTQHETIKALRYGATDYVTKDEAEKELAGRILDVLKKDGPAPRLRRLIESGESSQFECKETLRWNVHAGRIDKIPELAVAKTLSAFANTNGGTLVIGVKDDATVVGLKHDNFANRDAALLHLDNVIKTFLTDAVSHLFQARFVELNTIDVLRIDSKPATKPVYLTPAGTKDVDFYIRRQASSIKLKLDEAVDYIRERFWANSGDRSPRMPP